ncbi:hypothetical protein EIP91_005045 [Steccherinum ochraceum]|uniref:SAGA-associated factor 11 n=1 Tax=Steccherinum ochraceum TaxID=92696 RepID=A0A4R0S1M3_9APHY|nr:hypothetical protein EIP91_005045 [Steccherinum ochraceum]
MTKKERDEAITTLANRIYANMVDEIVMDVVLRAHREIARSRAVCSVCHTRCGEIHVPGSSGQTQPVASSSSQRSPHDLAGALEAESGTATPVNGKSEGTVYFECENCKRQIASNRYAPHLSSCLGLGNSRRSAVRNATSKTKLASEAGRSASPYVGSDAGNVSDDGKPGSKFKTKSSKAKRQDEAEFSLKDMSRKRNGSPSLSPAKKSKKSKTAGSGSSSASRIKSEPGTPNHSNSQSKIPSKLRETSILSSLHKDGRSESPDSRESSPARSVSTQASTLSFQSPTLANVMAAKGKPKNGKPKGTGPPQRRPSPPRLPPPPPPVKKPEHDYLVDVEGDETGSSTDTDSS